jgi:hypothetical protein
MPLGDVQKSLRRRATDEGGEITSLMEAKVLVEEYKNHYDHRAGRTALLATSPGGVAAPCVASANEDLTEELESAATLS